MKPRHQVSRAALELIESFEGYRRKAARLPDGRWTIGYGHTRTAREGAEVSPEDAEALLIYDLIEVSAGVNEWTFAPLSQNQFDALCAFALNIGLANFRGSQVLRKINEGSIVQAACAMDMWRKAEFEGERIVVDALVRRRAAEKAMFLAAPDVHAPTPILPPQLDYEATNLVPRRDPVEVRTDLDGDEATAERISPPSPPVSEPVAAAPEIPTPPPAAPAEPAASATPWPVFRPEGSLPEAAPQWPAPPQAAELDDDTPHWAPPEPEVPAPPADDRANLDLPAPPETPHQDGVETLEPAPQAPVSEPSRPFVEEDVRASAANESEPELFDRDQPAIAERVAPDMSRRVVRPGVVIDDLEPFPDADANLIKTAVPPMLLWLMGLGAAGLAVFAGGIFFGFHAGARGVGAVVGVGLGVVGIICVATAVYFLLERLGGREE